jgi:hypothetical protein
MKNLFLFLAFVLTGWNVNAQDVSLKVKSGDTELDANLTDINVSAEKDFALFKTEMKNSYNVTEAKIDDLKVTFGMQASDIFMTLDIAKSTGKSVDDVAAEFKKNNGKGWGVIAQNLGIKPGSDEFKALKGNAKTKNEKIKGKKTTTKIKTTKTMKNNGNAGPKVKNK